MADIEIRLLRVFSKIYERKNISQAAVELGLSQPTTSIHLSKLRAYYGDPLFVRSSHGMEPTPFAEGLAEQVSSALALIDAATNFRRPFDPLNSDRRFCLALTDVSHVVLLPELITYIRRAAPHVNLRTINISGDTHDQLEQGYVDVAIGMLPNLEAGFYQQKLFEERYICIVASEHPRVGEVLSLETFLTESHIKIASTGGGHLVIEKILHDHDVVRNVLLEVPSYVGLLEILAGTDLIAILPKKLLNVVDRDRRIKALELPPEIQVGPYLIKQHWHARNHHDEANQWLRRTLVKLFLDRRDDYPVEAPEV